MVPVDPSGGVVCLCDLLDASSRGGSDGGGRRGFRPLCFFPPERGCQFGCVAFTTGVLSLDSVIPDA